MSPHINIPFSRSTLLLLVVLLCISGTLILTRLQAAAEPEMQESAAQTAQDQQKEQLEAEIVTITPIGFEPAEITRPQGRFILAIDNRSGLDEVQMYLERDTGARVNSSLTRKGKLAWRDLMDLPPGVYILRAANDESWRCRVTLISR